MKLTMTALGISTLFVFAGPANALDWTFTVSYDTGQTASGTFTTNGVAHVVGQTYTISNIAGSHNGLAINGLYTNGTASQTFQWDGTAFNPDSNGIQYSFGAGVALGAYMIAYTGVSVYGFPDSWFQLHPATGSLVTFGNVTSAGLTPVSSSPSSAPGPLPLFGAAAAFSWSRRLRRRVSSGPQRLETPAPSATPAL
jgi:hypothetical protein